MILEAISVGPMQVNCYILAARDKGLAIIIDPGDEARKIKEALDRHSLSAGMVINTHGHYDHIGSDDKMGAPVYIHQADAACLTDPGLNLSGVFALPYKVRSEMRILKEGDMLELEGVRLRVMHTPGHTAGGISLHMESPSDKIVFTGDTLFCQGIGRYDLPGGSESLLLESIKNKLFLLADDTVIYPGHGPSSTIGEEKKNNPFLA